MTETTPVIVAVVRYGEKLRDTHVYTTWHASEEAAHAALRNDFADELGDRVTPAHRVSDAEILDILRWDHNVIVDITPVATLQTMATNIADGLSEDTEDTTYISEDDQEFTFTDAGDDMITAWLNDGAIYVRNETSDMETSITIDLSKSAAYTLGDALIKWSHQAD